MRRKKNTRQNRRFIPGPDRRNVKRGVEWLAKIIEGTEQGKKPEQIIEEMSDGQKRD